MFEPDGRAIPFVEEGEGPVKVVLLPAQGLSVSSLGTLAHVLEEEGFHLVRIGVRRGRTDGATLHDLAQDVVDVMDHIGLVSAWIGGHGFGGALARAVALDHHDHAEGIILVGVEGTEPLADEVAGALADAAEPASLDAATLLGGAAEPAFAQAVLTRHRNLDVERVQRAALAATPAEEWATLAPNLAILVVQGTADAVSTPANAEALRASAPGRVSLTLVEGAGHLSVLTHPGEVGFAIEDYLAWD
ncbi:alpha/beta fold hydrolase [Microbacterium sp. 18062]|uniref:alpha/beta fold hydrolase n=1 Tax=Microbacterium sp. 18062 TaxID=2681410 RepID=UPI001F1B8592|nr:alpha/beta hydrolase [Microbacterium sp. 18062]